MAGQLPPSRCATATLLLDSPRVLGLSSLQSKLRQLLAEALKTRSIVGYGTLSEFARQIASVRRIEVPHQVAFGVMSTRQNACKAESRNRVDGWAGTEASVPSPGLRPRYTRRSAHAWMTCSGTASNSRGFSCIT